jgi:hypothetical protein
MVTVGISVQNKLKAHFKIIVESPILINYFNDMYRLLDSLAL